MMTYRINPDSRKIERDSGEFFDRWKPTGLEVDTNGEVKHESGATGRVDMGEGGCIQHTPSTFPFQMGLKIDTKGGMNSTSVFGSAPSGYHADSDGVIKENDLFEGWPLLDSQEPGWNPNSSSKENADHPSPVSSPKKENEVSSFIPYSHPEESFSSASPASSTPKQGVKTQKSRVKQPERPLPDPGIAGFVCVGLGVLFLLGMSLESERRVREKGMNHSALSSSSQTSLLIEPVEKVTSNTRAEKIPTKKNRVSGIVVFFLYTAGFLFALCILVLIVLSFFGFDVTGLFA